MTEQVPSLPSQGEVGRVLNAQNAPQVVAAAVQDAVPAVHEAPQNAVAVIQNAQQNAVPAVQNDQQNVAPAARNAQQDAAPAVQDIPRNAAGDVARNAAIAQGGVPQVEPGLDQVMRRLKALEDAQNRTVDSLLDEIRHFLKSPVFTKDKALDLLLDLKLVARETKHAKTGYFEACLKTMREKSSVPPEQFKKYLEVLLGDKDQEKVLDMVAKVDKASRSAAPNRRASRPGPYSRSVQGRPGRQNVQCYWCQGYGHYQAACPERRNSTSKSPKSNAGAKRE
ncbi:hypothetical protein AC249_AIPGENE14112 [Exaiptasia diaphana]|nr:hypothetical protein AC249_AIPGENE14112 [Exaiptasia diaphana]